MKARVIAYYLPQFHPVKENDEMWGKGFTEWTNVAKAKPLYRGHYQPQIPADLGFYDLRMPEIREEQARLAKEAGIEGFCYWHYWFGNGRRILERPFNEVLESGKPDFPFCLGWANHSWSNKTWQKLNRFQQDTTFIKQEYLGEEDYTMHFNTVLPAFKDKRYITVDDKPLFLIFDPDAIPDVEFFIELWNKLAKQNGLKGIHFVARGVSTGKFSLKSNKNEINKNVKRIYDGLIAKGFDAIAPSTMRQAEVMVKGYYRKILNTFLNRYSLQLGKDAYDYEKIIKYLYNDQDERLDVYPQLVPRYDKTPRKGREAEFYYNNSPEAFKRSVEMALDRVKDKPFEKRILFVFAWNEWGEGAYLEPDIKYGHEFLDALKDALEGEFE